MLASHFGKTKIDQSPVRRFIFDCESKEEKMNENSVPVPDRAQSAFRKLTASAANLNSVSDELRQTMTEIEAALKKVNVGVAAWVSISTSSDETGDSWSRDLGYTRVGQEWHIAVRITHSDASGDNQHEEQWPFNDAPRWMRIEAVGKLPDLIEALAKQADDTAQKIRRKNAEAKQFTAAILATFPPPPPPPPPNRK
jgi:hypothetical protein